MDILFSRDWEERFNLALVLETERAIKQRDTFLETGVVTAGNGGSHDTCFRRIVNDFMIELTEANKDPVKLALHMYNNPERVKNT